MNYGRVDSGVIVEHLVASAAYIEALPNAADWVELPFGVGIGWNYDGANFTDENGDPPPPPPPSLLYRTLLTGAEWVSLFTDDEWAWLKTQRQATTAAGKALDKMMDAIRWTDSVNVASPTMDPFYTWLLNQGLPGGQTRIDELRQGILV